jgi:hypothetical protein
MKPNYSKGMVTNAHAWSNPEIIAEQFVPFLISENAGKDPAEVTWLETSSGELGAFCLGTSNETFEHDADDRNRGNAECKSLTSQLAI